MSKFVDLWKRRISLSATVPGRNLRGFLKPPEDGADFLAATIGKYFRVVLRVGPTERAAVALLRTILLSGSMRGLFSVLLRSLSTLACRFVLVLSKETNEGQVNPDKPVFSFVFRYDRQWMHHVYCVPIHTYSINVLYKVYCTTLGTDTYDRQSLKFSHLHNHKLLDTCTNLYIQYQCTWYTSLGLDSQSKND